MEATEATEQEIKDLKDELEELKKQLEAEEAKTAQPVTTDVPEVTIAGQDGPDVVGGREGICVIQEACGTYVDNIEIIC